jgi:creatinine amidohydrolase/Fe(II)-dependent formamide hydrolase-like protein
MKQMLFVSIVWVVSVSAAGARDQEAAPRDRSTPPPSAISRLEELTWPQIDALDRERTLFILPVGMIEQHGPHLPVGADTLGVTYEADRASRRVSRALPGWRVVLMPPLNYGHGGANAIGGMLVHPGTYAIRQSTLRSVVADLGRQLAENGFKWVFVMNGHGAPAHNIAINEACDFVSETFRVTMLHLTGLFQADAAIQSRKAQMNARFFSSAELSSFGMDVHAGVSETSGMLALRPDLVRRDYKALPSRAGRSLEELRDIATAPGWQGYLSAPARSTAEYGRAVEAWWVDGFTDLILRAVRGENMFVHPRFPDAIPPAVAPMLEKARATDAAFEARLEDWLLQRSKR